MRWCDLSCPDADFPKEDAVDGAGSCRTFAALYCAKLKRLVAKNAPCAAEAMAQGEKEGKGGDQA
ncbi:MAG: hypothetical protein K9K65_07930 [Desulfarculaceae bacterium]|nr:hypothetical protein [Desulfarculaceae bacterium]MCF8046402.1 hypothetical protein [Desulfarculaceae bacterium]MCF8097758.1 hypothetical protein [Desulfarculaceae bacterium]MCF8123162.1 hypothetical protein [Desulfarculaceae bacterium]